MTVELSLAYLAYLVWLLAGLGDFIAHRRTDLPHTSGVAESATHLFQLALLGVAVAAGLAFETNQFLVGLLLALVVTHAVVGYIDTRIAFDRRRVVSPGEQHLHSVLDMAPFIAFAWLASSTWTVSGWTPVPRHPGVPLGAWLAVLVPAGLVCVVPALLEFRAAWRARIRAAA